MPPRRGSLAPGAASLAPSPRAWVPSWGAGSRARRGPAGTAAGRRPGGCPPWRPPLVGRIRVAGWTPLHPPPGRDPRRPQTRPNPALFGPNFSGFLAPCGAAPRGGGGAPPTTLILLRNQRQTRASDRRAEAGAVPGRSGGAGGPSGEGRTAKIVSFFFGGCLCEVRGRVWQSPAAMWPSAGPGARPPPLPEVSDSQDGGLPAAPTPAGALLGARPFLVGLRGAAGGTPGLGPRLALANGLAPLAPATPLRGTAVPCLEGGAHPGATYPP